MISTGEQIGRYRIRSAIGKGGMGEVFLADDTELERLIALKILPQDLANDTERMRRFVQEAKSASALNHPNIITIHEIGKTDDTHFIATEYIEGETLHSHLKSDPMSLKSVLDVAIQVASALDAAHRAGIVHRDIKPENVMIRPDGFVKILDFGIAKLIEKRNGSVEAEAATAIKAGTQDGLIIGTASYMSPEQARGKDIDARSDIFSFGVVLYEMLSGKQPFEGESAIDTISSIIHKEPVPLNQITSDVPRELQHIVEKSLRKDRDERYQTAKDLLIDLKDVRQDLQLQNQLERTAPPNNSNESKTQILSATTSDAAHTTSSAEYVVSEIKSHKSSFAIGLIVLLLASIGLGYWFFSNRTSSTAQIESIAVLPFVNESGNADTEYLSDGMTESLITSLSQLPKLSVKARNSVFRYKGKEVEARKVGAELSVQAILLGRVVQRGQDLTLYVELIDAATENVLWKADYNRSISKLVLLQSDIAKDVSNKLKTKLSGADEQKLAKNYTANTEAYQLYLKGRFYANKRTPQHLQKSIDYFNQAIVVDQNYALAFTGLAEAYALLSIYGDAPPRESMPKARESALKALSLDDDLAEAHSTLGFILTIYDYDFAGAEREFNRAIELNPNYATAHHWYGILISALGRHEESLAEFRRALEIDPLSLTINRAYGERLFLARRYDNAIAQLKKTRELDASFVSTHYSLAAAYQMKGNYAECVEELAKYQELIGEPQTATLMRESYAKNGWQGFLRVITEKHIRFNLPLDNLAIFHAALGEKDEALAELNNSYENRESFMILIKTDSRLDPLRDDLRLQNLIRRIGLPQ